MDSGDAVGATRATWGHVFPMTLTRALTPIRAFWWPHVAPNLKTAVFCGFAGPHWGRHVAPFGLIFPHGGHFSTYQRSLRQE